MSDPRLELAEAAAFESLWTAAGLPTCRIAGAVCTAVPAAPDNTMLNRVDGLGLAGAVDDAMLDEIDDFFRGHGVTYAVGVSPLASAPLADRLRDRGFEDGYAWMKFRRPPAPPAQVETVLRVAEPADGSDFGRVVSEAYGMPRALGEAMFGSLPGRDGWSCFVAYDGDEPAGAAALYAHQGAGWLGCAGTVERHRGKGAQGAILAARIRRGRELGLDVLTTETGERVAGRPSNSYRNILRAGFEEAYLRPNLIAPA